MRFEVFSFQFVTREILFKVKRDTRILLKFVFEWDQEFRFATLLNGTWPKTFMPTETICHENWNCHLGQQSYVYTVYRSAEDLLKYILALTFNFHFFRLLLVPSTNTVLDVSHFPPVSWLNAKASSRQLEHIWKLNVYERDLRWKHQEHPGNAQRPRCHRDTHAKRLHIT